MAQVIKIGSKKFTESVILGEIATALVESTGNRAVHQKEIGGTTILWNALLKGDIDTYPEYTGTITAEIFAGRNLATDAELQAALKEKGVKMLRPLGFNNTYALGMKDSVALRLGIKTISDLKQHSQLRLGLSNEFLSRKDGWPGLKSRYALPQQGVQGLDHDLAYRGLESNAIDVIDLYSTDAEIDYYHLRILTDDLNYFPRYDAVLLVRADLEKKSPQAFAALEKMSGRITEEKMGKMNATSKLRRVPENRIAAEFLAETLGIKQSAAPEETMVARLWQNTKDHLSLVIVSLLAAIAVSIPLGIWAAKSARAGTVILGAVGVVQTVPSLALLVVLIPVAGIGALPAMLALFLYSLLPMVRNTATGITTISPAITQSADALGLPPAAKLWRIELPMALPQILAGVKTSAVINVGTATLGALVGAGGYGQPILTGIRLDDTSLILQGAVPAAVLALAVQALFGAVEKVLVSKGL